MNKVVATLDEAILGMSDGMTIMSGGFGLCGNPENLISAIHAKNIQNITIISNNCGTTDKGLGILLASKQVKKMISSYVGENKIFEQQYLSGQLEVELCPQGTFAERIRAGGFGIAGFYTRTGVGTKVAEGKETRMMDDGHEYVLEKPLKADFAIVRAWKADTWGNLVFRKTARNFSPMMCMAAKTTIIEAEHIVPVGSLDPDSIHVPSVFVHRIIQGVNYQKWIEQRTVRPQKQA